MAVGHKVPQLNVLLELQLKTSLMISVESANNRVDKSYIWEVAIVLAFPSIHLWIFMTK